MDRVINDSEPRRIGSFNQASGADLSLRIDDDTESGSVSEAVDIRDGAFHSNYNESGKLRFSVDNVVKNDDGVTIPEDARDLSVSNTLYRLPLAIICPPYTDPIKHSGDKKKENEKELPWVLEYISCLVYLSVFGILGVLTRYLLEKLFGPEVVGATSDQSYMYLDLPANMVGSFLMGWWGVVFKGDISRVSEYLAIGLTTGYLGSLTTFSGWNQEMLDLSVDGQWVFAMLGILLGLFLVACSISFGIGTAESFKGMLKRLSARFECGIWSSERNLKVDKFSNHLVVLVVMVLMLGLLWGVSATLEMREFNHGGGGAQLWLACMVAPLGVWIRWFLSRLNGRGLGRAGLLKWVPFGTLTANVSAACVMAALATLKKAVKTKTCDTVVTGIQFGLLGCLSTVSTFVAEFHAMRQSSKPWRAYAYAMTTIIISFSLGTLLYSVPVWIKGYD